MSGRFGPWALRQELMHTMRSQGQHTTADLVAAGWAMADVVLERVDDENAGTWNQWKTACEAAKEETECSRE